MMRTVCLRRRAAALGALIALAVAPTAALGDDTLLVKLDADATRSDRAEVVDLLDATSSRGLPAGWRAYRVPEGLTVGEARQRLLATDAELAVEADGVVRAQLTPNDPKFTNGDLFALPLIQAPAAWDLPPQGQPIIVAISDSGIDITHPDLAARIWTNPGEGAVADGMDNDGNGRVDDLHGWDFANDDASVFDDPVEDDHGTHVAGTIGAVRNNGVGVAGVADNVRLMPLKFLVGPDGAGDISDAITGIVYARQKGARVINASWGGSTHSQALCDAVQAAVADGIIVVAAAGNDHANNDTVVSEPADCPSPGVVSVAATTEADTLASFSNFGATTVDLGAPGVGIWSTLPNNAYAAFNGTSMATPHVSGAAALVLEQAPTLSPSQVRAALMGGGATLASLAGKTVSGRRLQVVGALNLASDPSGDTVPPTEFTLSSPAEEAVATFPLEFSWEEALDLGSGVARYRVLVNDAVVADVDSSTLEARVTSPLPEGRHTWRIEAEDRGGNRRSSAARTVLVDPNPPQPFSLAGLADGASTKSRRPSFQWTEAADPGVGLAGYRLVVGGITSPTYAPDTRAASPVTSLPDGTHRWRVEAVDRLDRVRSSEERTVIIDSVGPTAFGLRSPLDHVRLRSRRPAFTWTPSKDLAGAVTYEVLLNGKVRATGLKTPSWRPRTALKYGAYRWTVNAVDAAGNVRTSPREFFTIAKPRPKKRPKRR
jgi:subtilisin family serine protease